MTGHSAEGRGFDTFFTEHFTQVRRYAARRFGDNDAEDIAQETMLRAYAHLDTIDDGRPVLPWLRTVALRVGLDAQRRRRPESMDVEQLAEYSCSVPDHTDEVAMRVDLGGLLHRALRLLSVQDREALALHAVQGVGIEEIAARTGATSNAIRQRLFRARRNFGRHYAELGGGEYTVLPPAPTVRARVAAPVQRVATALHRVASRPGERFPGRAVAAATAVVTAGAALTFAPPHAPHAHGGDPVPPPRRTATVPARLPAFPVRAPVARPPLPALPDVDLGGLLGHGRVRPLPFAETWESGLGGWSQRGAAAATDCATGLWSRCSLRLDPAAPSGVAVTRALGAPLAAPVALRYGVSGPGTTSSFDVRSGAATLTVTTTLGEDNGGRVVVSASDTTATAGFAIAPSGWAGMALWVVLDLGRRTVRVLHVSAGVAIATTALALRAAPRRLDEVTFRAPYTGGAAPVRIAAFDAAPPPACVNGGDDDGDGLVDTDDPGCDSVGDSDESPDPQCADGIDNDGDGATDWPDDPSCTFWRGAESTACSDGTDDDGDGWADYPDDPDCTGWTDDTEVPLCRDGADNENDGTTDYPDDPGCSGPDDDSEWECLAAAVDLHGVNPVVDEKWRGPSTSAVCLDPVERLGSFGVVAQAPAAEVRGYLDRWSVTGPDGVPREAVCVALTGTAGAVSPCAALGGTFAGHVATLVSAAAEPVPGAGPAAHVDVCTAAVMVVAASTYASPLDRERVVLAPC